MHFDRTASIFISLDFLSSKSPEGLRRLMRKKQLEGMVEINWRDIIYNPNNKTWYVWFSFDFRSLAGPGRDG